MRTVRITLALATTALTAGSLAGSAGYAMYLRSDGYRRSAAAELSESLGLPSDIGGVRPRSLTAREFNNIQVWLPDRVGVALSCHAALVIQTPTHDDPEAYELSLNGGTCEISPRTWLRRDYRDVLETGLRPGFTPGGPTRVRFRGMDVHVQRDRFTLSLRDASGEVAFAYPRSGMATIMCYQFNGHVAPEPVFLDAAFSPRETGIQVDRIEFSVPRLPLRILRLGELTGAPIDSGVFDGRLTYSEGDVGRTLTLSGHCADLALDELTAGLPRPWRGRCPEVELTELRFEDRWPTAIRFRGMLADVPLGDVLAPWGFGEVVGAATLRVNAAELSSTGIVRLVAAGECGGVVLESATAALGRGRMSGELRLVIRDLSVVDNHLAALDADVIVGPSADGSNWVEGELLRNIIKDALHIDLPAVLPERIHYTQLGLRLEVRDEVLRIYGSHGDGERTILTVRLFGVDVAIVKQPDDPIDLRPHCDALRAQAAAALRARIEALRQRTGRTADAVGGAEDPRPDAE